MLFTLWAPPHIFLDASLQTVWYLYTTVYFCQLRGLSHLHPFPRRRLQLHQPRAGEWHQKKKAKKSCCSTCLSWTLTCALLECVVRLFGAASVCRWGKAPRVGMKGWIWRRRWRCCSGVRSYTWPRNGCLSSGVLIQVVSCCTLCLNCSDKVELSKNWPKYLSSTDTIESFPCNFIGHM